MNEKELQYIVREVFDELKHIGIPVSENIANISINKRTKKRLGACKIDGKINGKPIYNIEISASVLGCDIKHVRDIVAHELLHTCPDCFDHGKKWKEYARGAAGAGYCISRTIKVEDIGLKGQLEVRKAKYRLVCPKCGQIYERMRLCPLIKNPEKYRCGRCKAQLTNNLKG